MTDTTDTDVLLPVFEAQGVTLYHGDCIDTMRRMPANSVDAIVTDPPYALEFMGKDWDAFGTDTSNGYREKPRITKRVESDPDAVSAYAGAQGGGVNSYQAGRPFQTWCAEWAAEALRVLKPGGHLVAFGAPRTYHRLTAGIEDAGFEIRDTIAWLYGTGFPKSMDVSKAIEATLTVGGSHSKQKRQAAMGEGYTPSAADGTFRKVEGSMDNVRTTPPAFEATTAEAQRWEGWGTALKPGFEPAVVARKPLAGTVARNLLAHGTGALNIDANRIAFASEADRKESTEKNQHAKFGTEAGGNNVYGDYSMVEPKDYDSSKGRWPTNVLLDDIEARRLDAETGTGQRVRWVEGEPGEAGVSRFFPTFRYEAKAGAAERPKVNGIQHPTVKPLNLMRWLCRLIVPPGGTVLDPFAGSGTTVEAALLEGFECIGIEREPDYIPLTIARVSKPLQVAMFGDWEGEVA